MQPRSTSNPPRYCPGETTKEAIKGPRLAPEYCAVGKNTTDCRLESAAASALTKKGTRKYPTKPNGQNQITYAVEPTPSRNAITCAMQIVRPAVSTAPEGSLSAMRAPRPAPANELISEATTNAWLVVS